MVPALEFYPLASSMRLHPCLCLHTISLTNIYENDKDISKLVWWEYLATSQLKSNSGLHKLRLKQYDYAQQPSSRLNFFNCFRFTLSVQKRMSSGNTCESPRMKSGSSPSITLLPLSGGTPIGLHPQTILNWVNLHNIWNKNHFIKKSSSWTFIKRIHVCSRWYLQIIFFSPAPYDSSWKAHDDVSFQVWTDT